MKFNRDLRSPCPSVCGVVLVGLIMLAWAPGAPAASAWTGTVTAVVDGDTVWVKRGTPRQRPSSGGHDMAIDIRIEGIDAPEMCQTYGPQAKAALTHRVLNQVVRVRGHRTDTYGRTLAKLSLGDDDVGDWMVRQGHAWSYRHRRNAGPYAAQESLARGAQRGLFATPGAEQPRDFRKRHGTCHPRTP